MGWVHEKVDGYPDDNGLNPGVVGESFALWRWPKAVLFGFRTHPNLMARLRWRSGKEKSGQSSSWMSVVALVHRQACGHRSQWMPTNQPLLLTGDATGGTLKVATRAEDGTWSHEVVHEGTDWTGTDETGAEITRDAKVW